MMTGISLDPNDNSTQGKQRSISATRRQRRGRSSAHDGMNQLGYEGGRPFNPLPYRDYTGFGPVNTAYKILNPSHWQPSFVTRNPRLFSIQQFVTPQWRMTIPYTYGTPSTFVAPIPLKSNVLNLNDYRQQADDVLNASANLTDIQKMTAEL